MLKKAHELKKQLKPPLYYYPNQLRTDLENEFFTFLYHPYVPADNASERAIRNVKVKQKISGQFKIPGAAENFAILRSIIETAIKNNPDVAGVLSIIAAYKRN